MTYNVRPIDCVAPDEDPGDYYVIGIVPQGPLLYNTLLNLGLSQEQVWHGTYYQSEIEFVFKELVQQIVSSFDYKPQVFVDNLKKVPVSVYFEHIPILSSDRSRSILKQASYQFALMLYAEIAKITGIYSNFDILLQSVSIDTLTIAYSNKELPSGQTF